MKSLIRHLSFLIIGLAFMPSAFADVNAEREVLAKIVHEIEVLESLINQAVANAEQDTRIRFQYDWLRQDLKQVKDGIQAHIDSPRVQPRSFPPLRGDYRR